MFGSFRSYIFGSVMLATGVVAHAAHLKHYFYPSVVYLNKSKFAWLACGNLLLALILLIGKMLQALCLGPLRLREVERLHIRIREAVIETCFAMTVFRGEFNEKFVGMFAILLFLKIFHWLSKDRIEFMEEQPNSPLLQHGRLVCLMVILFFLDVHLLVACVSYTIHWGPSMLVLFAFEFSVLIINLLSNVVRYIFLSADLYLEGAWEAKGMFSFYNELLSDMLQLSVYMVFFVYVQVQPKYTLPLHIIRDIWLTFNKFVKRWSDFKRYRRVMSTMDEFFQDATAEDLAGGDGICIICREELQTNVKKLACGHMFHKGCLQGWLKRQLNCPTCRRVVDVNANQAVQENAEGGADGQVRRAPQPRNQLQRIANGIPAMIAALVNQARANLHNNHRFVHNLQNQGHAANANVARAGGGGRTPDGFGHTRESGQGVAGASAYGNPTDHVQGNSGQTLPLERLIRIQEQLNALRDEVADLVVEAALASDSPDEEDMPQEETDGVESTSKVLGHGEESIDSREGQAALSAPQPSTSRAQIPPVGMSLGSNANAGSKEGSSSASAATTAAAGASSGVVSKSRPDPEMLRAVRRRRLETPSASEQDVVRRGDEKQA